MSRAVLCAVCAALLAACGASRVLVVFPVPSRGHTLLGDALVKTLVDAGHQVTYISPHTVLPQMPRLTKLNISLVADAASDRERVSIKELVRSPQPSQEILAVGTGFAERVLEHNLTQQLLNDTDVAFDLVVAEWFFSGLLAPLASVYQCPLVWYSAADASWASLQLVHGHTNPAHSAAPLAREEVRGYGVGDRLGRLWGHAHLAAWLYYTTYYVEPAIHAAVYRGAAEARGSPLPEYETAVYNASLLLVNSQPLLGRRAPLPAAAKYVGGHHLRFPVKALTKNFQQLLDRSHHGVIFFDLGSALKGDDLPERALRRLADMFGHLEQTVIWRFDQPFQGIPRNLHIVKNAPQRRILNHTNTKLFITTGAPLACLEAAFFGVPIISIPVSGEQPLAAALAAARGGGIVVGFGEDLPYRLLVAVQEILGNYSYHKAAQEASAILQNSLVPPDQELLYWIEVILQHGGGHLASPAVHLSLFQKLYLDIVAIAAMILWFLSKVVKVIKAHWGTDDEFEDDDKKQQ